MTMKWKVRSALAGIALMIAGMCAPMAFGGKAEAGCSRGYGRCYASGCYCRRFEGSGNTCYNCGHGYFRH